MQNPNQTTVADLIAALEGLDPETPVQIAHQPSYPIAAQITRVAADANGVLTIEGFGQSEYYERDDLDGNLLDY